MQLTKLDSTLKINTDKIINMIKATKGIIKNGNIHKIDINNIMDSNTKNKIEYIKKNISEIELIRLFNKVNINNDITDSIDNIYNKIKDIQHQKLIQHQNTQKNNAIKFDVMFQNSTSLK